MKIRLVLAAALVATSATPAYSYQAAGASEVKDADKVVCRREPVIGSRVQKRTVCMKRSELIKLENGTRDGMSDYLKQSTAGASRAGGE
jgi:hypothetical protein